MRAKTCFQIDAAAAAPASATKCSRRSILTDRARLRTVNAPFSPGACAHNRPHPAIAAICKCSDRRNKAGMASAVEDMPPNKVRDVRFITRFE